MSDLGELIAQKYVSRVQRDSKLRDIGRSIRNGGGYADAEKYAVRVGEVLSEVLRENITADNFSVGVVDEIAKLIIPSIKMNYEANSQASALAQKVLNTAGGLGMNPIATKYDESTAMNIAGRMAKYESFEDAEWMLNEPMVTNSISNVDNALHANADFQYKSGLRPKIVRTCESDACEWCQMLEDEYDYEEVKNRGNPVYQRHNNCTCEITYEPGDGRVQDVKSKQWYDDEKAADRLSRYINRENDDKNKVLVRIPEYPASSVLKKVKSGRYSLKLSWNSYNKHVEGTPDYKRYQDSRAKQKLVPQGALLISKQEAQDIINKQSGTGIIKLDRHGNPLDHEYITCDRIIGKHYDKDGEHLTNKARIDHGNRGSHLIPIKGNDYD